MAQYTYTSMDRVFAKLIRDVTNEFNEEDVIEWTGEALSFMGSVKSYESAVAFIEVKNHQFSFPKGLHAIIQLARSNNWTPTNKDITPASILSETQNVAYSEADNGYIVLDEDGKPLLEYDIAYYRPYFDLVGEHNSNFKFANYSPIRLSNHTFFNSLVCTEIDPAIYENCVDEYTIINRDTVRLSFQEGFVALSYLRQAVDKVTGYPMIPDTSSHLTAIIAYITMKLYNRQCFNGREGACGKFQMAEQQWQWYCKQGGNLDLMPSGIDDHQDLLDQKQYLLPRNNQYFGFFGNLNRPENRGWSSSNRRNRN